MRQRLGEPGKFLSPRPSPGWTQRGLISDRVQKSNTDSAGGLYDGLGKKKLCVRTPMHLQTIAAAPLTADATNAQVAVIFFFFPRL